MDTQKRNQFLAILGKLHIPVTRNNCLKQNQASQKLNLSAHSSHKSNHSVSDKRKTLSKQSKSHQKSDSTCISHKNAKKQYQESSQKNKQSKKLCKEVTLGKRKGKETSFDSLN